MEYKVEEIISELILQLNDPRLGVENIYWHHNGVNNKHSFIYQNERNIYSHTKSFLSILVGISIDKKELSLNDTLDKFFYEEIKNENNFELAKITVSDLLNMSSGFLKSLLMHDDRKKGVGYPNYLKYIFNQKLEAKPGSKFHYSNGDCYLLGRILEKVTNRNLNDIAYERLFKKLDIPYPIWQNDFQGHPFGGSGLILNIADMNKLGQLILNEGKFNTEQIVSKEYVNDLFKTKFKFNSTWSNGYKNYFWINKEDEVIRADGMYNQLTIIFKKHNLAFSLQCSEISNVEKVKDILEKYLVNKLVKTN